MRWQLVKRKNISIFIFWTVVILWMFLIFNLSSQVAEQSDQLSTGITEVIVDIVENVIPPADLDINEWNHIIRKCTHFFVYLILGILVLNALRRSGAAEIRSVVMALGICILYAISDEVHQLFVNGRGAQVTDVLINSAGIGVGIGIYLLAGKIGKRRKIAQN
jgi:VanZ family protein